MVDITPEPQYLYNTRMGGPVAGLDVLEKKKVSLPLPGLKTRVVQPVLTVL
jgi:hypothetical protein